MGRIWLSTCTDTQAAGDTSSCGSFPTKAQRQSDLCPSCPGPGCLRKCRHLVNIQCFIKFWHASPVPPKFLLHQYNARQCRTPGYALSSGNWAQYWPLSAARMHESNSLRARHSLESSPLAALFWRTLAGLRNMILLVHALHRSNNLLKQEVCMCTSLTQAPHRQVAAHPST